MKLGRTVALLGCLSLGACAYNAPVIPPSGLLFSNYAAPIDVDVDQSTIGKKLGESSSYSILGLIAFGDASVTAAAEDGGLSRVDHLDYSYTNFLFIYHSFTTRAYGE
jgi:hypothetical protein